MSLRRKVSATISIILCFVLLTCIWRYFEVGKEYNPLFILAIILIISINRLIFKPGRNINDLNN